MKFQYLFVLLFLGFISCKKTIPSLAELESKFITVDDFKVHYKSYGTGGNDLVFIHGWGCDMNAWEAQFSHFIKNNRVVLIDLPGYGKSDQAEIEYTQDLFAKAVKEVLDELHITSPILIGHSLGFPVSRQVIRNYPELNSKMCVVDGVYFKIPRDSTKTEYLEGLKGFSDMFQGKTRLNNTEQFIQSLFIANNSEEVKEYANHIMLQTPEYVGYNTMIHLIEEKVWNEKPLDIPVLAVYVNIPELPDDNETYLKQLFPNLSYQEIDSVGHFVMMENPAEFKGWEINKY
jgi:pimeloyl-ACP methyl ester carboxylesterase